jgi:hypothetical protein
MKNKTIFLHIALVLACGVILTEMGILLYNAFPSLRENIALATTVKPETFTELYFEDHLNLPKETTIDKSYSFKFTIHNLEYKDMVYPYEVYIASNGGKLMTIDKGEFSLKQDQYLTILERYTFEEKIKRAKVVVDLHSKKQQIDYWIGETL